MNRKDAKETIYPNSETDGGSYRDNSKFDEPYLNHENNALNNDLKLPQVSITISHVKMFKEAFTRFCEKYLD